MQRVTDSGALITLIEFIILEVISRFAKKKKIAILIMFGLF